MTSSTVRPAFKFWKTVATGMRVPLNTHAPLRLPGTLPHGGTLGPVEVRHVLTFHHLSRVPHFSRPLREVGDTAAAGFPQVQRKTT